MINICRKCCADFQSTPSQEKKKDFICTDCQREYNRAYRAKRKAEGDPIKSKQMPSQWHTIYYKDYSKNPEVKKRKAEQMKEYANDPILRQRHQARWETRRAIKSGNLIKRPCEKCGEIKVEAHHDDYNSPLDIRWLCSKHHREFHKNAKAKGEQS